MKNLAVFEKERGLYAGVTRDAHMASGSNFKNCGPMKTASVHFHLNELGSSSYLTGMDPSFSKPKGICNKPPLVTDLLQKELTHS